MKSIDTKSSAIAGALTSPQLRTPVKVDRPTTLTEEMSGAFEKIMKDSTVVRSITKQHVDSSSVGLSSELTRLTMHRSKEIQRPIERKRTQLKDLQEVEQIKKIQFTEGPAVPNQTSQNTILIKAPRNRGPLIRTQTTWESGNWTTFSRIMTVFIPSRMIISIFKKNTAESIQSWREKTTLCLLFLIMMFILAFVTFLITEALCNDPISSQLLKSDSELPNILPNQFVALGRVYMKGNLDLNQASFIPDVDVLDYCSSVNIDVNKMCTLQKCIKVSSIKSPIVSEIRYSWNAVIESNFLFVYNSHVVNLKNGNPFIEKYFKKLKPRLVNAPGRDTTTSFRDDEALIKEIKCFSELFKVGVVDTTGLGCFTRDIINNMALITILSLIFCRFVAALCYSWFINHKLIKWESKRDNLMKSSQSLHIDSVKQSLEKGGSVEGIELPIELRLIYSILMVTCYSEDETGLRTTLDSLCDIQYPNRYKLIVVICDGQITGSKQTKSTPEIVTSLMDLYTSNAQPKSYISIADGSKRHNMAKIHCGSYTSKNGNKTSMIAIEKCGTPKETIKAGNRGKRDSQIILMDFYKSVLFNLPMSPFQFELFNKIYKTCGVTADKFEIILMVDADTKVQEDALNHFCSVFANDASVSGLCGETKIMNKSESFWSAIQVFEYLIAHHLAKSFESCFGGVTCLPGCFSVYRIKAPRFDGTWTPILASPDIVSQYSENSVNTLHKKNLLLLGEDRFLSTLMLRTYPNRKMMFIPKAICRTTVPTSFKVLLSQRRRWINSTIHNLFELLLVQELCGTFCFSMQFVVLLELIGTVTLPAAIVFTL